MLLLLQVLRAFSTIDLPEFVSQVQDAIQSIVDAGQQLQSRLLDGLINAKTAAMLYFLSFDFRNCLNIGSSRLVIPLAAIDYSSGSQLTQTSSSCAPLSAMPNCEK